MPRVKVINQPLGRLRTPIYHHCYFHQIFTNPRNHSVHPLFISITQNVSLLSPSLQVAKMVTRKDANLRGIILVLIHNIDSKRLWHHQSQKRVLTHSIAYKRNLHFFDNFLGCHLVSRGFQTSNNKSQLLYGTK